MKRTFALIGLAVVVVGGIAAVVWLRSGPDPAQFADLANGRLVEMPAQKVVEVQAVGDPNIVAGRAFKLLFSTYYRLSGVSRMTTPPAPRARWQFATDTPRAEWRGFYALPIPDSVTELPSLPTEEGLTVRITEWPYGAVAEILHIGRYSAEEANIRRLHEFIADHGYRTIGDHEEEYVRGPGMIFAGDPDKYITIIRLRVQKAEDEAAN